MPCMQDARDRELRGLFTCLGCGSPLVTSQKEPLESGSDVTVPEDTDMDNE